MPWWLENRVESPMIMLYLKFIHGGFHDCGEASDPQLPLASLIPGSFFSTTNGELSFWVCASRTSSLGPSRMYIPCSVYSRIWHAIWLRFGSYAYSIISYWVCIKIWYMAPFWCSFGPYLRIVLFLNGAGLWLPGKKTLV